MTNTLSTRRPPVLFEGAYRILGNSTKQGPDPEVEKTMKRIRQKAGNVPVADVIRQEAGVIEGNRVYKEVRMVFTDLDADEARPHIERINAFRKRWPIGTNPPPEESYQLSKAERELERISRNAGGYYRHHLVRKVNQKLDGNSFDWLDGNNYDQSRGDWYDILPGQGSRPGQPPSQRPVPPRGPRQQGFWEKVAEFLDDLFGV